mgnify:CR=1 FL=1
MIAVHVPDEVETPGSVVEELRHAWQEGLASGPGSGSLSASVRLGFFGSRAKCCSTTDANGEATDETLRCVSTAASSSSGIDASCGERSAIAARAPASIAGGRGSRRFSDEPTSGRKMMMDRRFVIGRPR